MGRPQEALLKQIKLRTEVRRERGQTYPFLPSEGSPQADRTHPSLPAWANLGQPSQGQPQESPQASQATHQGATNDRPRYTPLAARADLEQIQRRIRSSSYAQGTRLEVESNVSTHRQKVNGGFVMVFCVWGAQDIQIYMPRVTQAVQIPHRPLHLLKVPASPHRMCLCTQTSCRFCFTYAYVLKSMYARVM